MSCFFFQFGLADYAVAVSFFASFCMCYETLMCEYTNDPTVIGQDSLRRKPKTPRSGLLEASKGSPPRPMLQHGDASEK